jgi:hypothetical protein
MRLIIAFRQEYLSKRTLLLKTKSFLTAFFLKKDSKINTSKGFIKI